MKAKEEELFKLKDEYRNDFKNKIYKIYSKSYYFGEAFVYAENAKDANEQIAKFKASDPDNAQDSWGYSDVQESDFTGELTDEPKQVTSGIYYRG